MTNKKNLHLVISVIIITIISLGYGLSPNNILPEFFDVQVESIDLKQIFRAMTGLYLGMIVFWMIGILKPPYWQSATISNVLFMTGLASGRIISFVVDGIPSISFLLGIVLEITLALWGIINLNKYQPNLNK